ncbi:MAG: tetratricopeptide repeat protein [Gemmatimonadota bacterium]
MSTEAAGGDEIRRFEEQYRNNPDSLVFARLADAYRKAGDPDRALQLLDEGIRRHRDYPSAHIIRARTFIDLGRAEEADAAFRHVLTLDAQNLVAMRGLAELAEERGDHGEAAGWYERIAALDPLNAEASEALLRLRGGDGADGGGDGGGDVARAGGMEPLEPTSEEWWTSSSPISPIESEPLAPEELSTGLARGRFPEDVAGEMEVIGAELVSTSPEGSGRDDLDFDGVDLASSDPPEAVEAPPEPAAESSPGDEAGSAWWFEDPSDTAAEDDGDLLTRTMADLYARQGLVDEAAAIYRELLVDRPGDPELERALAGLQEGHDEPTAPDDMPAPREALKKRPEKHAEADQATREGVAEAGRLGPGAVAVDRYASHVIPTVAGRSQVFLEWLGRLE